MALFAFDNYPKLDARIKAEELNPVKKLLFVLQVLEKSDGLQLFMQRVGKTYSR